MEENEKVLELKIFKHEEFGEIRTLGDWEDPKFCLVDLCRYLELDPSAVMRRLEDGVISSHPIPDALGRTQKTNFVNEDGLYDVIFDSRKPEAKKFRKWVTSEVLPTLRKTGTYTMPGHETKERVVHIHFGSTGAMKEETSDKWLEEKRGEELGRIARMLGNTDKLNTAQKYLMNEAVHSLTGYHIPTMGEFNFANYYGKK